MWDFLKHPMESIFFLFAASQQSELTSFYCPETPGGIQNITIATDQWVSLQQTTAELCTLVKIEEEGSIPIGRSYEGYGWERVGTRVAASLPEFDCNLRLCRLYLSAGSYNIQNRPTSVPSDPKVVAARFLEAASFGATPEDLEAWNNTSPGVYVKEQMEIDATYHREFYRTRMNPVWRFHKPEFAATLDPCDPSMSSTWRRNIIDSMDRSKNFELKQVDGRLEIYVNGHIRSVPAQLRYHEDSSPIGAGLYLICSTIPELRKGVYKLKQNGKCRRVASEDLIVSFPEGVVPPVSLSEPIPELSDSKWTKTSEILPEYHLSAFLSSDSCSGLPEPDHNGPLVFAKTWNGEWMIHDPRVKLEENTVSDPIPDGGAASWLKNETRQCSNVRRSFLNEQSCVLSKGDACKVGATDKQTIASNVVVCGSPGEVSNNPDFGDYWLDMPAINRGRSKEFMVPQDTNDPIELDRQKGFVWNTIALTAPDQLRQRVAWTLLQIFALPKSAISVDRINNEIFLVYYDIFVRNAFGNYMDILREITYSPLMAESLSYRNSKSLGHIHASTRKEAYPDENFARELMQLFTIGLIELNNDGTPYLNSENKTVRTYDSEDIMSFARIWTGFTPSPTRANVEGYDDENRFDPMTISASWRDSFPKANLYDGFIGDGYPLCEDLPKHMFRRNGAKYRLLGKDPAPELYFGDKKWANEPGYRKMALEKNVSGLYEKLCAPNDSGECRYPTLVVLDGNLWCPADSSAQECQVDTVRVVQVGDLFYEYVNAVPCVSLAFFENGVQLRGLDRYQQKVCANPLLADASDGCCVIGAPAHNIIALPECVYSGERMTFATAQQRCASVGKELCEYNRFIQNEACPHIGHYWSSIRCRVQAKINSQGKVAIVHDTGNGVDQVSVDSPNFFRVFWNGDFPSPADGCSPAECYVHNYTCICNVEVSQYTVFQFPPEGKADIGNKLHVGHAHPSLYNTADFEDAVEMDGYRYFSPSGTCCDENTVFEVVDDNGRIRLFRNVESTVLVSGTGASFRNPPQFNSAIPSQYSVTTAEHESEALLEHLLYHKNTPPFVAYRFIQRFGVSNPSPRYVRDAANAFRDGIFSYEGILYGSGQYGDLAALTAAVLLDREARSVVLENDPSSGSLREPILKVIAFMRAMKFESSAPLVFLDRMDVKVGQQVFRQPTVFSYFRPEYSAPGVASAATLTSPEAEVMSAGKVIGLLNGLFSLFDKGLEGCGTGFGQHSYYGCEADGQLTYEPKNRSDRPATVNDLSTLLTAGRLFGSKQDIILQATSYESDDNKAWRTAAKLITTTPEFHSTSKIDSSNKAAGKETPDTISKNGETGYKAVIHLQLHGGADSYNMLVPHPECSRLSQEYKTIRDSIAQPDDKLLRLDGDFADQPCSSFGLHDQLSFIKELFDGNELLLLANTGVLTQHANKANFGFVTETQLFSHNSMQDEVDSLDPKNIHRGTGVLGRLGDSLLEKGYRVGRTAVETNPRNLAGRLEAISPVFSLDENGVTPLDVNLSSPILNSVMRQLNEGEEIGVFGEVWSTILNRSLNQTEKVFYLLNRDFETLTNFTENNLGERFRLVSQLIANRATREMDRDLFTVRFEGFDMHPEVHESLYGRFLNINTALRDFVTELKLQGVWGDVVIIQTSDFGRTLTPNSGGGSDHGWGGNYWMTGGSLNGGRILGKYPTSFSQDDELVLDRGRMIPTTAWECPFNAIAEWMGITDPTELDVILPNRGTFSDELFASSDIFHEAL